MFSVLCKYDVLQKPFGVFFFIKHTRASLFNQSFYASERLIPGVWIFRKPLSALSELELEGDPATVREDPGDRRRGLGLSRFWLEASRSLNMHIHTVGLFCSAGCRH